MRRAGLLSKHGIKHVSVNSGSRSCDENVNWKHNKSLEEAMKKEIEFSYPSGSSQRDEKCISNSRVGRSGAWCLMAINALTQCQSRWLLWCAAARVITFRCCKQSFSRVAFFFGSLWAAVDWLLDGVVSSVCTTSTWFSNTSSISKTIWARILGQVLESNTQILNLYGIYTESWWKFLKIRKLSIFILFH